MFRVVEHDSEEIVVEVTRSIREGMTLRMNPSEAFLGIESGLIKVVAILPYPNSLDPEELTHISGIPSEDILVHIRSFTEAMIDLRDPTDPGDNYKDEVDRLGAEPWVVYQYSKDKEWAVLPIEEFVDHTMHY